MSYNKKTGNVIREKFDLERSNTLLDIERHVPQARSKGPRLESSQETAEEQAERRRRYVFTFEDGDDRVLINCTEMAGYPWVTTVRVSTGCSGFMVGPRHVLTAGHCVHDVCMRD